MDIACRSESRGRQCVDVSHREGPGNPLGEQESSEGSQRHGEMSVAEGVGDAVGRGRVSDDGQ